jgi:hypothetical protein
MHIWTASRLINLAVQVSRSWQNEKQKQKQNENENG